MLRVGPLEGSAGRSGDKERTKIRINILMRSGTEPGNQKPELSEPFVQEPKREPEPSEPFFWNRNRCRNRAFPLKTVQKHRGTPFPRGTVGTANRNRSNRSMRELQPKNRGHTDKYSDALCTTSHDLMSGSDTLQTDQWRTRESLARR